MSRNHFVAGLSLLLGAALLLPNSSHAQMPPITGAPPTVLINEFVASNQTGLEDEDGDTADWIELFNPGPDPVNLAGWSLTDSRNEPRRWVFPDVVVEPGSYLVVFASDKDRTPTEPGSVLHTNFKLDAEGERLLLYAAGESPRMVAGFSPRFPPQSPDVSFGRDTDTGQWHYFAEPTPGRSNAGVETIEISSELRLAIDAPKPDEAVSGRLKILGTADVPSFLKWQLDLLPGGHAGQPELLEVDTAPAPVMTELAKLDTESLPDGVHALRLRAVRSDGNYDELVTPFVVANNGEPAAATLAAVRSPIFYPGPGDTLTGAVEVAGTVAQPGAVRWDLLLLPHGADNATIWLASGESTGGFTVPVDTARFADGAYALSLRVVREDGNYAEHRVNVVLANSATS